MLIESIDLKKADNLRSETEQHACCVPFINEKKTNTFMEINPLHNDAQPAPATEQALPLVFVPSATLADFADIKPGKVYHITPGTIERISQESFYIDVPGYDDPYGVPLEEPIADDIPDFDNEIYQELSEDIEEVEQKKKVKKYSNKKRWNNLTSHIRTDYLRGDTFVEIQKEYEIIPSTWDNWYYRNTRGFKDFILSIKDERFIQKAEKFSNELLEMDHVSVNSEGDEKINERLVAVKQKETEFVRETLDKKRYSKRQQIADPNDNPLKTHTVIINKTYITPKPNDDSHSS